jgi:hypothetical protein
VATTIFCSYFPLLFSALGAKPIPGRQPFATLVIGLAFCPFQATLCAHESVLVASSACLLQRRLVLRIRALLRHGLETLPHVAGEIYPMREMRSGDKSGVLCIWTDTENCRRRPLGTIDGDQTHERFVICQPAVCSFIHDGSVPSALRPVLGRHLDWSPHNVAAETSCPVSRQSTSKTVSAAASVDTVHPLAAIPSLWRCADCPMTVLVVQGSGRLVMVIIPLAHGCASASGQFHG